MAEDLTNPYVGLRPFEEGDQDRFFGRAGLASKILSRLESGRLAVVTGESGAGKTSVVRAAVIPGWRAKHPGGRVTVLRPDARRGDAEAWGTWGEGTVSQLFVVDPLEDLFLKRDGSEAERERAARFAARIVEAVRGPQPGIQVLLVLRDDFLGNLRQFPDLAALADAALCRVMPPAKAEWQEMIVAPARSRGVNFESGLVSTLLEDLHAGGEGMLPHLQYALSRLWDEAHREGLQKGGKIHMAAYQALGGVRQALALRATQVFQLKSRVERQRLRAMLMSLITFHDTGGRTLAVARPASRLILVERGGTRSGDLLKRLVAEGFLRTCGHGDAMELGHEALMTASQDFAGWIAEAREARQLRQALSQSAGRWLELRRRWRWLGARAQLWRGGRLTRALEFHRVPKGTSPQASEFGRAGGLSRIQEEFLKAARRGLRSRELRPWMLAGVMTLVALAALALSWRAVCAVQATEREEKSMRMAAGTGWLARSRLAAERGREVESGFLAGFATGFAGAGRESTLAASEGPGEASARAVAPLRWAGRWVKSLEAGWPGVARLVDGRARRDLDFPPLLTPEGAPEEFQAALSQIAGAPRPFVWSAPPENGSGPIGCAAFHPAGRILASGSGDGAVKLWDVASGRESARLTGFSAAVVSLAFEPTGRLLAACSSDGAARLWDLTTKQSLVSLSPGQEWGSWIGFHPDGRLLRWGADGRITQWNAVTGRMMSTVAASPGRCLALAPSGNGIGIGASDGAVWIWDPEAGREVAKLPGHSCEVRSLAFRADGALLASGDAGGALTCWEVRGGTGRWSATVPGAAVQALAFDARGDLLAGGLADGTVRVWEASQGKPVGVFSGHGGPVTSVGFTPDGSALVSASEDGTLKFWILRGRGPFDWFRYVREGWVTWDDARDELIWQQKPAGLPMSDPDLPPDCWLGLLRQASGPEQGRRLLTAALNARNWEAAVLLNEGGGGGEASAEWLVRAVRDAVQAGDAALTELRMRQGDGLFSEDPDWALWRGAWCEKKGERGEALAWYRRVNDARGWRGVARLAGGNEALEWWRRVLGSDRETLTAGDYRDAGTQAAALGRREEARDLFREGIGRFGADASLQVSFGKALSRWGEFAPAREHLERGVEMLEDAAAGTFGIGLPEALSELGMVLVRLGRLEDAWQAYQRALAPPKGSPGSPTLGAHGAGQQPVELLAGALYLGMLLGRSEVETLLAEAKDRAEGPEQRAMVLERHGWGLLAQGRAAEAYQEFGQALAECAFREGDAAEAGNDLLAGLAAAGWLAGSQGAALDEFEALVQRSDGKQWLQPGFVEALPHLPRQGVEALIAVREAWRERGKRPGA